MKPGGKAVAVLFSARPSHVLHEIAIELPRPRDELATKADPRFLEYRRTIYDAIVHPEQPASISEYPAPAVRA